MIKITVEKHDHVVTKAFDGVTGLNPLMLSRELPLSGF